MKRFKAVNKHLFRGSAPSRKDIINLSNFGFNNILSLDQNVADDIAPICQELGMKHTILPINLFDEEGALEELGKHNLNDLLEGKTFVHCRQGKDRTGLLIALYRTMAEGWSCLKAIREAKRQGFGTGVSFPIQEFFAHIIHSSCSDKQCPMHPETDHNELDTAVQQSHDSQFTDNAYYGLAPYVDYDMDSAPYGHLTDVSTQYQNRADYQISGISEIEPVVTTDLPQVGTYDSISQITNLTGPSVMGGGMLL